MLNSYSFTANPSQTVSNALSINAVSGTMSKRHPLSRFVIVPASEAEKIFDPENPRINWGKVTVRKTESVIDWDSPPTAFGHRSKYIEKSVEQDKEESIVVLQAMILGDNKLLCEVVRTEDWIEEEGCRNEAQGDQREPV